MGILVKYSGAAVLKKLEAGNNFILSVEQEKVAKLVLMGHITQIALHHDQVGSYVLFIAVF
jgi:hypothetical protein